MASPRVPKPKCYTTALTAWTQSFEALGIGAAIETHYDVKNATTTLSSLKLEPTSLVKRLPNEIIDMIADAYFVASYDEREHEWAEMTGCISESCDEHLLDHPPEGITPEMLAEHDQRIGKWDEATGFDGKPISEKFKAKVALFEQDFGLKVVFLVANDNWFGWGRDTAYRKRVVAYLLLIVQDKNASFGYVNRRRLQHHVVYEKPKEAFFAALDRERFNLMRKIFFKLETAPYGHAEEVTLLGLRYV